jgi:hypothetical protein
MPMAVDAQQEQAMAELIASRDPERIPTYLLRWCTSAERPRALLDLYLLMAPGDGGRFWRLVADEWPSFDAIPHQEYSAAFKRFRAAWSPDVMAGRTKAAFLAMPSAVDIYRGQDGGAPLGLAWTLRRDVAESFARGHRGRRHRQPTVFTITTTKSAIALLCDERDEAEVVLFNRPRKARCRAQILIPAPDCPAGQ